MKKIAFAFSALASVFAFLPAANAQVDKHTIEINGNVVANTCQLFETSGSNVIMADVLSSEMPTTTGATASVGRTAYTLGLQNCVPNSAGDITVSYNYSSALPSSIQNGGTAKGVALQLLDSENKPVEAGKVIEFKVDANGQHETPFNVVYQKTADDVTIGTVTGTVTFNFNYI